MFFLIKNVCNIFMRCHNRNKNYYKQQNNGKRENINYCINPSNTRDDFRSFENIKVLRFVFIRQYGEESVKCFYRTEKQMTFIIIYIVLFQNHGKFMNINISYNKKHYSKSKQYYNNCP